MDHHNSHRPGGSVMMGNNHMQNHNVPSGHPLANTSTLLVTRAQENAHSQHAGSHSGSGMGGDQDGSHQISAQSGKEHNNHR